MYTHLHTVSQTYWANNNLVEVRIPGTDDMSRFAVRSKPEEWTARAKGLFDRHQYQQAIHAYKRAHMEREVSVASAYQLRVQAQQATKNPTKAFLEAARAFFACGTITSKQSEIQEFFRISGECYVEGKKYDQAAKAYEKASLYNEAAHFYLSAHMLDHAVSILKKHEGELNLGLADRIKMTARCAYLNEEKFECVLCLILMKHSLLRLTRGLGKRPNCSMMQRNKKSSCKI